MYSLQTSTLNDLLEIYIEGPTLAEFSADSAIKLWLSECTLRPQQSARKKYKSREQTAGSSSITVDELESNEDSETQKLTLDEWDQWFCSSDDSDISSDGDFAFAFGACFAHCMVSQHFLHIQNYGLSILTNDLSNLILI